MARRDRLTIFDFDGTLCRLATDYDALRSSLLALAPHRRATGLLDVLLELEGDRELGAEARRLADEAELRGLERGSAIDSTIALYADCVRASQTTVIASHNGAPVIRAFLAARCLPEPDELFDRRRLAAPKDESVPLMSWLSQCAHVGRTVVGDGEPDRRLAERLGADFVEAVPA